MTYAGIGSRETPDKVRSDMGRMGETLARLGWTLRTGGADGADDAFLRGAQRGGAATGALEVFLPWSDYNGLKGEWTTVLDRVRERDAMEVVSRYHPAWTRCRPGARKLHARNAAIIHGATLDRPVDAVVCWTPNGVPVGGTATGIRMAEDAGIPVFNLARFRADDVLEKLAELKPRG